MIGFEPVEFVRGDGKTFWQPQCDGLFLYKGYYGSKIWLKGYSEGYYYPLFYRFRWVARMKGKKKTKRIFQRKDSCK